MVIDYKYFNSCKFSPIKLSTSLVVDRNTVNLMTVFIINQAINNGSKINFVNILNVFKPLGTSSKNCFFAYFINRYLFMRYIYAYIHITRTYRICYT